MHALVGSSYLLCTAAFFFLTALVSAWRPERFAAQLGLSIANPGGLNEIRSQYAGFFLAAAVLCVFGVLSIVPKSTAVVVTAVIFGGLLAGRLLSLVINRGFRGFGSAIVCLYVIDALGFAGAIRLIAAGRSV